MTNEATDKESGKPGRQTEPEVSIRSDSLKFLYDVVSASYKEQNDLDESVWRSMPFIAALFGLAVTVMRFVPPHLDFLKNGVQTTTSLLYIASMASFVAAFIYFWSVAMPRYFETPAKGIELRNHARALTSYYADKKTADKTIDGKVADDMRSVMIDQLSNAMEANRPVVEKRLSARSRTILLLLAGFAFISVSEMLIFSMNEFGSLGERAHADSKSATSHSQGRAVGAPDPTQGNAGAARR
jgi:hypothetical protein